MGLKDFLILARSKAQTIASVIVVFLIAALILTFIQPLKYGAQSQLLMLQDLNGSLDPYNAAKSNEFLSNILAKVAVSDSFFGEVMDSGFNIDKSYFPERADKRLDKWEQTIDAKALSDTGIITVSIYHPDKYQLEQIARAVNYVYKTKNAQYHGGGDKVSVKIIDEPVISRWPVKPNIPVNLGLAVLLGLILSLWYIYLFPEEKYSINLWPRFKRKKVMKENNIVHSKIDANHQGNINNLF